MKREQLYLVLIIFSMKYCFCISIADKMRSDLISFEKDFILFDSASILMQVDSVRSYLIRSDQISDLIQLVWFDLAESDMT